jgi:hypothetical protein
VGEVDVRREECCLIRNMLIAESGYSWRSAKVLLTRKRICGRVDVVLRVQNSTVGRVWNFGGVREVVWEVV